MKIGEIISFAAPRFLGRYLTEQTSSKEGYQFYYVRELNRRGLLSQFTLEMLIQQLMEEGPPDTVASFASREEAEAWLAKQTAPPTPCLHLDRGGALPRGLS